MKRQAKVVVLYKSLPHYRKPFFERLKKKLEGRGVDFSLIYGEPEATEASKKDLADISWANKIKNTTVRFCGRTFYWQPCLSLLKDADLIIVEQANKLLVNYYLWILNLAGISKLAFWGHGKNFQASRKGGMSEALKRFMSNKVYWWFAYNELAAKGVKGLGYPEAKITVVQNAIDTRALSEGQANVSSSDLQAFRTKKGIRTENVAIYSGGMYEEKRLDFLLEACQLIKKQVPDFEMIFLGAGPGEALVKEAARKIPWIHYEGPKFDNEKVPYFMISKLLLMPGLVGLVVLDAFALGVPLITTNVSFHSPEIEYLVNGVNGEIVEPSTSVEIYAARVARLLTDEESRQKLVDGCWQAREKYTIENMVDRFAEGVEKALTCAKGK